MRTTIAAIEQHENFLAGRWAQPASGKYYVRYNPAHPDQELGRFPMSSIADVQAAIEAAESARAAWAETPGPQRGALLLRFAQLLEDSKEELASIITLEQGKALCESRGEVGRAVVETRFMAGEASHPTGDSFPSERPGFTAYTVREPLGTIAAISPWNFPVVTPVRKIAPALAYGNTVICKPASLTPWCAVYLLRLLEKAGLPPGVVNLVIGPGADIGEALVADRRIRGITFTGSSDVGLRLYKAAAARMASVQLELGGKNPAIVVDYDDLDGAAREIVAAAFLCSGQRCTALSRVIVVESQAANLTEAILSHVSRIKVGDGMLDSTTMGPLVSRSQYDTVDRYVREGVASRCRLLTGGQPLVGDPDREGYYFAPTVFDEVTPSSPLATEEIFGPVLPILRVRDADEAIAVANATRYGLAAAAFTSRVDLIPKFIARLETGMVHINHGTASQAHVPFGGRKDSGQGAFSIGPTAREFFTTVKAVYVKW